MSRNREIEEILEVWWLCERGAPNKRAESERKLNVLLDRIVDRSDKVVTRDQILNSLFGQYKDYKAQRNKSERLQVVSDEPEAAVEVA